MKLIVCGILSFFMFYVGDIFGSMMFSIKDIYKGFMFAFDKLFTFDMINPAWFSFSVEALGIGLLFACFVWMIYLYDYSKGNMRKGEEHGSASWGTLKEGKGFMNQKSPDDNILLSKNYGLAIRRDKFDLEHDRNCNVLGIGGSGSGKTRYYVKPNLLQMNSSDFVTDPKGTLIGETGQAMADNGYDIRCFDTINFIGYYNPLYYVKTDADILSFVNCLIKNTNGKKDSGGSDPFWENSEKLLYVSLIAFLRDWCPKRDYTLSGLLTLLGLAKAKDEDEDFESPLDLMFKEIETGKKLKAIEEKKIEDVTVVNRDFRQKKEVVGYEEIQSKLKNNKTGKTLEETGGLGVDEDFALSNYKAFKTAAGKTLKSIIISCNVRLKPLSIEQVRPMLEGLPDENGKGTGECGLKLDTLGDPNQKSIIYAIMSDTDKTFSFLHAICMWQAINLLCEKALTDFGGKLPTSVHFYFDEFANIGLLPDIEQTIAVTRSRNILVSILLQSLSQLDERYDKSADTIIDCCDTTLFLGGKSNKTNKQITEMLGKETIDIETFNESRGGSGSTTKNQQKQGRDLMDAAEVGKLSRTECLILIAGAKPLKDKKYPLEKHKRYDLIDPGHKGAKYQKLFSIKKYMEEKREKELMMT